MPLLSCGLDYRSNYRPSDSRLIILLRSVLGSYISWRFPLANGVFVELSVTTYIFYWALDVWKSCNSFVETRLKPDLGFCANCQLQDRVPSPSHPNIPSRQVQMPLHYTATDALHRCAATSCMHEITSVKTAWGLLQPWLRLARFHWGRLHWCQGSHSSPVQFFEGSKWVRLRGLVTTFVHLSDPMSEPMSCWDVFSEFELVWPTLGH